MREVRVASVQPERMAHLAPFEGQRDRDEARRLVEANLEMAERLLDRAGAAGCDIVCYPEDTQGIAHYGFYLDDPELFSGLIETIPGPTTERLAAVARRHAMHLVFGLFERDGDHLYTAAVLLGRSGELLGKYRKVHLPIAEAWTITRGNCFPVFTTDFGRVGLLICYDIMFPEAARCLSLNGAELLLNPTMSYSGPGQCPDNGLIRLRMRALDSFAPLVVSLCGDGSAIVDSDGTVVALAQPGETVIRATVDLDATPRDPSHWEVLTGTADLKARLLRERQPETYGPLVALEPPALAACPRLRSTPDEIRTAYQYIRQRWSGDQQGE